MTYTSVDRIFAKVQRDFGVDASINDMVEWAGEALAAIDTVRNFEEAVAFVEVKNHQCPIPSGLQNIIQIAKNNRFCRANSGDPDGICPSDVVLATPSTTTIPPISGVPSPCGTSIQPPPGGCGCHEVPGTPVAIDCHGTPLYGWEGAYYRPYFDLRYEYDQYRTFVHGYGAFSPVHLATSSFGSNMVCTNVRDLSCSPYINGRDEYTIAAQGAVLRFSFQDGQVAIAYNRQVTDDETGYPMIPDTYACTTAISMYIMYKMSAKEFYQGREGAKSKLDKAEADWQWYCRQAANNSWRLQSIDEYENLLHQRNYMIPRLYEYNNFFGHLGRPEGRKFNDPNGYNQPYMRAVW